MRTEAELKLRIAAIEGLLQECVLAICKGNVSFVMMWPIYKAELEALKWAQGSAETFHGQGEPHVAGRKEPHDLGVGGE